MVRVTKIKLVVEYKDGSEITAEALVPEGEDWGARISRAAPLDMLLERAVPALQSEVIARAGKQ